MTGGSMVAAGEPFIRWQWIGDHLGLIWQQTLQHLWLTFLAVTIGAAISIPVGIYAHRHRRVYAPVTFVSGLLYTIPSLALFVLLLPITGLTTLTAEIGLVSYTLLILIRNTVAGLDSVPPDVREAASGMGYTRRQLLWGVEMPLALPAIMAGIRIATVTTISLATVAAFIGVGGLGQPIFNAIQSGFKTQFVAAGLLAVALALVADALLVLLQRMLAPWMRARRA